MSRVNNVHEVFKTGLELSLGSDDHESNDKKKPIIASLLKYDHLCPSDLTLGPIRTASDGRDQKSPDRVLHRQASSLSAVSSFSNSSASTTIVKRDRDRDKEVISGEEYAENNEKVISDNNLEDDQDLETSPRKKLRLTKQQSALLEDNFKEHTTLNPKQKHDLAKELNLRPRQVEVWFQNRRARTKLKQTEADYEQWKKCCETLTEENKRLQKELKELRSIKVLTAPFYTPFATSSPLICPSCQRLGSASNKPAHFLSTTNNQHSSSAAC